MNIQLELLYQVKILNTLFILHYYIIYFVIFAVLVLHIIYNN